MLARDNGRIGNIEPQSPGSLHTHELVKGQKRKTIGYLGFDNMARRRSRQWRKPALGQRRAIITEERDFLLTASKG